MITVPAHIADKVSLLILIIGVWHDKIDFSKKF